MTLANSKLAGLTELQKFKEDIAVLLVSGVFVMLTADLTPAIIGQAINWNTLAFLLCMASAKETVAAEPENHDARFELAEKLIAQGKNSAASDHLLTILSDNLDWGEGKAKAKLLEIFEAAGPKDPVTVDGRRRLGSLMLLSMRRSMRKPG